MTMEIELEENSLGKVDIDETPTDEAHMILELISETLRTLFRIGVLVRKAAPSDRFDRALRHSNLIFPAVYDIDYVRQKHSKMIQQDHTWLAERLGRGIAKRRQFIKYCRDHKTRLAADEADIEGGAATVLQSSKATTLQVGKLRAGLAAEDGEEDDIMSFMSASSTTEVLSILKLPRLVDLSKDGQSFECPICFTLQPMKQEKTWR